MPASERCDVCKRPDEAPYTWTVYVGMALDQTAVDVCANCHSHLHTGISLHTNDGEAVRRVKWLSDRKTCSWAKPRPETAAAHA